VKTATEVLSVPTAAPAAAPAASPGLPREPASLSETGLPFVVLVDLVLKALYRRGQCTATDVAAILGLPLRHVVDNVLEFLKAERLAEVRRSAAVAAATFEYGLSESGVLRAREALERNEYLGPAPVPVGDYIASIRAQAGVRARLRRADFESALSQLVLPRRVLDSLGPAFNRGRSLFIFGPPGNGKTTIAEVLGRAQPGAVLMPHAVLVDDQIVRVYDPVHHRPLPLPNGVRMDARWMPVARPLVVTGGELTLELLDLGYQASSKIHHASLQLKATGGILLVDDFGRQRVPPAELLNRWIVPLDRGVDYYTLHNGAKVELPFELLLVFATNLAPADLVDEAFMRRIRYKVRIDSPSPEEYAEIFRRVCERASIPFSPPAAAYVLSYCAERRIIPRACHPRDLVEQLVDMAAYREQPPALSPELLMLACESYFVQESSRA
jgi:predicted ATPase with chaperone activity